ncbi:hypothetical protein DFH27DRAFT_632983 [Peziza echinospora]|nr:hypothetical protein DFH27DRAFT_632983 [Peziza echinospora]
MRLPLNRLTHLPRTLTTTIPLLRTLTTTSMPPSPPTKPTKPPPSVPRLSSCLLLLNHKNQLLLVSRPATAGTSFSSALVFPGGNLDKSQDYFLTPEYDTTTTTTDSPTSNNNNNINDDDDDIHASPTLTALKVCAIRETFEETGILYHTSTSLSTSPAPAPAQSTPSSSPPTPSFPTHLTNTSISLPPALPTLHLLTTWITPPTLPRRYRTTMFLAFLPSHCTQDPILPTTGEVVDVMWMSPQKLLSIYNSQDQVEEEGSINPDQKQKKILLFPPQVYLLTLLSDILARFSGDSEGARREMVRVAREEGVGGWVIEPYMRGVEKNGGRTVLGLDRPRGDKEKVVAVKFTKGGPSRVEVLRRGEAEGEGGAKL